MSTPPPDAPGHRTPVRSHDIRGTAPDGPDRPDGANRSGAPGKASGELDEASGGFGIEVADPAAALAAIEAAYRAGGLRPDRAGGLTVRLENGSWFTVRSVGSGPALRFTAGGADAKTVRQLGDVVLALVRGVGLEAAA
ncbi:hypothetical protein ABZX93_02590 [Streptomyces sp. NPDC006632]|uniref:hypothetical protein n=1 Tax=unclassified Streptomyces TaxID=2593676 RepID=UPI002E236457